MGLEVRLLRNVRQAQIKERQERELHAWRVLQSQNFATILDIGANEGQFARVARRLWPDAHIHSFEPLPDVHALLAEGFSGDRQVTAHNLGLGERAGVMRMHRSAFSPSSSLLPMAELHRSEWPQSVDFTEVDVRIERLDDWASSMGIEQRLPVLVKIDVQGFELEVIGGGRDTIRAAAFIVLEVSFHELYQGQALFGEIHERMKELGFAYRGNVEQFCSKDHRRVLYADAIFENIVGKESHD